MKHPTIKAFTVLGAVAMALHMVPAFSSRAPNLVSGSVTGIQARTIVVNGVSYAVQIQGAALHQLEQLHVGDQVQLVLTGPQGAASTQVSAIRVRNAR